MGSKILFGLEVSDGRGVSSTDAGSATDVSSVCSSSSTAASLRDVVCELWPRLDANGVTEETLHAPATCRPIFPIAGADVDARVTGVRHLGLDQASGRGADTIDDIVTALAAIVRSKARGVLSP